MQRTLEDGRVRAPSGVVDLAVDNAGLIVRATEATPWVPAVEVIIWLVRRLHVGGVFWSRQETSRTAAWVLVDAVHAHPRHGPRPVVGPAVLMAPALAAASALQQPPVLSTRPACVGNGRAFGEFRFAGSVCGCT